MRITWDVFEKYHLLSPAAYQLDQKYQLNQNPLGVEPRHSFFVCLFGVGVLEKQSLFYLILGVPSDSNM